MTHRHLLPVLLTLALSPAAAQVVICPGEPLVFQLDAAYYGTKTWEHSVDGVTWNTVEVIEDEPFSLQPEQAGWYRVRFHDAECDTGYVSEAQRFAMHTIELGAMLTLSIGGQVTDEWGMPLSGATVRAGCGTGVSATTDHFGVFLLQGVTTYEKLAHVSVEKEGYFTGSRSFVPAESAEEAISQVYIALLPKNEAGTVAGVGGGSVALEGVTISFPANAFVQHGQPYTGEVSVSLNHIDPTSDELHRQMPGMLMGVMDDEPQLLLSYGMVGVELSDEAGQPVQLAPGSLATVRFPVMPDQQADAPAVMPLWWFDEELGYWVHEGEALLEGDEYVGQVAHFSWWNCDVPGNFVELKGPVIDLNSGVQLTNAQVVIITETMGTGITYTNGTGDFSGLVPIGEELTIQIWLPCGVLGAYVLVHEELVGPFEVNSVMVIGVNVQDQSVVLGTVLDCDSVPVEEGYALVNGVAAFCVDGVFQATTCAPSITLRGVDISNENISELITLQLAGDTTNAGELLTCTPLFGSVTDIEGNSYQTVLIGDQEWMEENLRTGTYNDGTPIPHVTDNTEWGQFSTGVWCNYGNNAANDAIYGKLYNWFTAADPNLCPQGWHVPTDAEWQQLEATLGMPANELGDTGYRGSAQNVGGMLKATTLWNAPNTGAINESAFSGLPAGNRNSFTGNFDYLGSYGSWWSASESGNSNAWYRSLDFSNAGIIRNSFINKRVGFSIRCVRD